jgi:Flp pilus assembly pilin Flp
MYDAMKRIAFKLWADDDGALIAAEYLFVATILVIGTIIGLTSIREAINTELSEAANAILALSQGYTISGQAGSGASVDGSQAIDTPAFIFGAAAQAPSIPSLIDNFPGS